MQYKVFVLYAVKGGNELIFKNRAPYI